MGYENLAAKKEADRAARLARIEARNKPGKKAKVFSPSNTSISETDVQTTNVITGGASA
ncbi:MAG: hypothetical protein GTO02_04650, partial [Candidatus Dadabacteria bacterium]|nr:hypothetical protein [Candidatus Dadabacteria bacterium]NIQ13704.1 hypothetical protein [Candidatus Dadabacteria bacterium]